MINSGYYNEINKVNDINLELCTFYNSPGSCMVKKCKCYHLQTFNKFKVQRYNKLMCFQRYYIVLNKFIEEHLKNVIYL